MESRPRLHLAIYIVLELVITVGIVAALTAFTPRLVQALRTAGFAPLWVRTALLAVFGAGILLITWAPLVLAFSAFRTRSALRYIIFSFVVLVPVVLCYPLACHFTAAPSISTVLLFLALALLFLLAISPIAQRFGVDLSPRSTRARGSAA